jgi:cytidylate kinase
MRQPENETLTSEVREPRHGFQGDRAPAVETPWSPPSLTIAVSREAGSRGGSIARRVGAKLRWQIYNQELLEYMAQEGAFRQELSEVLTPPAVRWVEEQMKRLDRDQVSNDPSIRELARIMLTLGAQGDVVLIGRGAGCILPPESTLHVRIIAPLADRVAYMSQWLRLTVDEAAKQVEVRDRRRAEFIAGHFHRQPAEIHQYDLLVNSGILGEEHCAQIVADAAKTKLAGRRTTHDTSVSWAAEEVQ